MFKNKNENGSLNICGKNIAMLRIAALPKMLQRALADKMQLHGIDIDKNAVQRIEAGKRFVTDIEVVAFSEILNVSLETLLRYN